MEALVAVALAGNILQFIETGVKLTRYSKEILTSIDGTAKLVRNLDESAADLRNLVERMKRQSLALPNSGKDHAQRIQKLATDCVDFLGDAQPIIDDLKQRDNASRWKAWAKAGKIARHQTTIRRLMTTIDTFRSSFSHCLLELLSDQQRNIEGELKRLSESSKQRYTASDHKLQKVSKDVEEVLQGFSKLFLDQDVSLDSLEDKKCTELEVTMDSALSTVFVKAVARHIGGFDDLQRVRCAQEVILESLRFESMSFRCEAIVEAHHQTYEWIFSSSITGLPRWLKSNADIFWVSGKPGCGKSTFMKFLSGHDRTREILREWSGAKPLIMANFYFWRFGSEMQKSIPGLLQSLVYEVLAAMPALIPIVLPKRWEFSYLRHQRPGFTRWQAAMPMDSWTVPELVAVLETCAYQHVLPVRICLFIDGLDEYQGNYQDITQVITKLAKSDNVKICLASRPENVFHVSFSGEQDTHIRLHELTRADIEAYVASNLTGNELFRAASRHTADFEDFAPNIIRKAEGVFLWVSLAVSSLLDGLVNGDSMAEMKMRLDKLPPELDTLFQAILDSIDSMYKQQSDEIFLFCILNKDPYPLLAVPHVEETARGCNNVAQNMGWRSVLSRIAIAKRRVNARCRGLMEARWYNHPADQHDIPEFSEGPQVQFCGIDSLRLQPIHRTVWEFLETKYLEPADSQVLRGSVSGHQRQTRLVRLLQMMSAPDYYGLYETAEFRRSVHRVLKLFIESNSSHPDADLLFPALRIVRNLDVRLFRTQWDNQEYSPMLLKRLKNDKDYDEDTDVSWHSYFTFILANPWFEVEAKRFVAFDIGSCPRYGHVLQACYVACIAGLSAPICSLVTSFVLSSGINALRTASYAPFRPCHGESVPQTLSCIELMTTLCPEDIRTGGRRFPIAEYSRLLSTLLRHGLLHEKPSMESWEIAWIEGTLGGAWDYEIYYGTCSQDLPVILDLYLECGADPNQRCVRSSLVRRATGTTQIGSRGPDTPWLLFLCWLIQQQPYEDCIPGLFDYGQRLLPKWMGTLKGFIRAGAADLEEQLLWYPQFSSRAFENMGDSYAPTALELIRSWTSVEDFAEIQAMRPNVVQVTKTVEVSTSSKRTAQPLDDDELADGQPSKKSKSKSEDIQCTVMDTPVLSTE